MTEQTDTESRLMERYGEHLDTEELAKVFKYSDAHSVLEAVRKGTFPVKTFRIGTKRVADVRDVAKYLDDQKRAA